MMNIENTLQDYGLTAYRLAKLSGVSKALISRIASGERPLTPKTRTRLRRGLQKLVNEKIAETNVVTGFAQLEGLNVTEQGEQPIVYDLPAVEAATAPPPGAEYVEPTAAEYGEIPGAVVDEVCDD